MISLRQASKLLAENGTVRSYESVRKMVKHGAVLDESFLTWCSANPRLVSPPNGRPPNHECRYANHECKGRRVHAGEDWACQTHKDMGVE